MTNLSRALGISPGNFTYTDEQLLQVDLCEIITNDEEREDFIEIIKYQQLDAINELSYAEGDYSNAIGRVVEFYDYYHRMDNVMVIKTLHNVEIGDETKMVEMEEVYMLSRSEWKKMCENMDRLVEEGQEGEDEEELNEFYKLVVELIWDTADCEFFGALVSTKYKFY